MQKRKVKYKHNKRLSTYFTGGFADCSIHKQLHPSVKAKLRDTETLSGGTPVGNTAEVDWKHAILNGKRFVKTEYSITGKMSVGVLQQIKALERRLDTLVYKAGFARSITHAKQMINHKFVSVNHTHVNVPGLRLQPGDLIQIHTKHPEQSLKQYSDYIRTPTLEVDADTKTAIYLFHPYQAEYILP